MAQLITFIGTGDYQPITYRLPDGRTYKTRIFPTALIHWFAPDEVTILLTQRVREHINWKEFEQFLLEHSVNVNPVTIPMGASEQELWEIFKKMTHTVHNNRKIIFDITYAFRSIPIVTFLVIAYLSAIRNINEIELYYGAFEAKENDVAPVFNLTPFVNLIQWIVAANFFMKSGDSRELADLIQKRVKEIYQSPKNSSENKPRHLRQYADNLRRLSLALFTSRPHDIARYASHVTSLNQELLREAHQWIPPLTLLLQPIQMSFQSLTQTDLPTQKVMIRWLIDHRHLLPAALLIREYLITAIGTRFNHPIDDHSSRKNIENALNAFARPSMANELNPSERSLLQALEAHPNSEMIRKLWNRVRNLRNDLAHCGYRSDRKTLEGLQAHLERCAALLEKLPL